MFSSTPRPPYYAVIFTSTLADDRGYAEVAERMNELAAQQPGYLGIESARGADGFGISVSYWRDAESMRAWKANVEHLEAQKRGRESFYARYVTRVAKVERDYEFGA